MELSIGESREIVFKKVFGGIVLISEDGEKLSICMRDSGYEFMYGGKWYSAKEGMVDTMGKEGTEGKDLLKELIGTVLSVKESGVEIGDVSDGYHTFNELYEHRDLLMVALANKHRDNAWKSTKHVDGSDSYEGYFVLGIGREPGKIISYHIDNKYWELAFVEPIDCAYHDGFQSIHVPHRLKNLSKESN